MKKRQKDIEKTPIREKLINTFKRVFRWSKKTTEKSFDAVEVDTPTEEIRPGNTPSTIEIAQATDTVSAVDLSVASKNILTPESTKPLTRNLPHQKRQPVRTKRTTPTIPLAKDLIHQGDYVMIVSSDANDNTTLAMTIAYDLCLGKAPRVFGFDENVQHQHLLCYYLNRNANTAPEIFTYSGIFNSSYEEKVPKYDSDKIYNIDSLIDDITRRIEKVKHEHITIIIDGLDKIKLNGEKRNMETDKRLFKRIKHIHRWAKNKQWDKKSYVTTIITSRSIYIDNEKIPYKDIESLGQKGNNKLRQIADVIISTESLGMETPLRVIREQTNPHRNPHRDTKLPLIEYRTSLSRGTYFAFERWINKSDLTKIYKTHQADKKEIRGKEEKLMEKYHVPTYNSSREGDSKPKYPRPRTKITTEEMDAFFKEYMEIIYVDGMSKDTALRVATWRIFKDRLSAETVVKCLGLRENQTSST